MTKRRDDLPQLSDAEDLPEQTQTQTHTKPVVLGDLPPNSQRDRPYLIVLAGTGLGAMYRVTTAGTVIGRGGKADVRVEDEGVSRRQARIFERDHQLFIEDLGSANGTALNDALLRGETRPLADGDKIGIGATTILKFTFSDDLDEQFQRGMYDAALRDRLTGAFNKAYLLERLGSELAFARRHQQPLGLLMVDVDHFKRINDTRGHLGGDFVLEHLGRLLQSALRTEDVLARYGGEEFSVICRGSPLAACHQAAERLRALVCAGPVVYDGFPIALTISVGAASWPENPVKDDTALIEAADHALIQAKRTGRNRVVLAK